MPEGRTGTQCQDMRQEVAHLIHHVDDQSPRAFILTKAEVNVQTKDQQTPGYVLHIAAQVFVAFIRRDGLIAPARKGVSRGGGDSLTVLCRDLADGASQAR